MLVLLGYGGTTKAIAKKFSPCAIFDDKFQNNIEDEYGNILYPQSYLIDFLQSNRDIRVVTSPGISPHNLMVQSVLNILGHESLLSEYDFFADVMPPSVWISGTNGKTTTTQMLSYLLSKRNIACGGNIGTPLADLSSKAPLWILETSSFTLHYTNIAKPNLYILLPISEDHLSWHSSYSAYVDSKLKPLLSLRDKEIAIIPDALRNHEYCSNSMANIIFYKDSKSLAEEFYLKLENIPFKEPFLLDATLALCATKILYAETDYELLSAFKIGEHKIEEFYDRDNRLWVDDSKGTNVDATIQAIDRYKDMKILLILGGDDKGASLDPLFSKLSTLDIQIYAIGSNADRIKSISDQLNISCLVCDKLEKAVLEIKKIHSQGMVGLLSPAAASLDQFSSYKERGELFKKYVLQD